MLFLSACILLASACPRQQHPTALTDVHSIYMNIYGQAADTHRRQFALPIPFPRIHDIAGAQQKHGIGLGSTQIRDCYLGVCVCVCVLLSVLCGGWSVHMCMLLACVLRSSCVWLCQGLGSVVQYNEGLLVAYASGCGVLAVCSHIQWPVCCWLWCSWS